MGTTVRNEVTPKQSYHDPRHPCVANLPCTIPLHYQPVSSSWTIIPIYTTHFCPTLKIKTLLKGFFNKGVFFTCIETTQQKALMIAESCFVTCKQSWIEGNMNHKTRSKVETMDARSFLQFDNDKKFHEYVQSKRNDGCWINLPDCQSCWSLREPQAVHSYW